MAEKEQIGEAIRRLVAEQAGSRFEAVLPTSTLQSLGFDSLDDVELSMAIEDEFEFVFSEEECDKLCASNGTTVQSYIDVVASRVPA